MQNNYLYVLTVVPLGHIRSPLHDNLHYYTIFQNGIQYNITFTYISTFFKRAGNFDELE